MIDSTSACKMDLTLGFFLENNERQAVEISGPIFKDLDTLIAQMELWRRTVPTNVYNRLLNDRPDIF
jgi:hypothetical protein